MAWTERRQEDADSVAVVAKRCLGQPRPVSCKPHLPSIGGDKDSILYTRQELAERLRRAWRQREESGHSLDIFLAHSSVESKEDNCSPIDTTQTTSLIPEDASLSEPRNNIRDSNSTRKNTALSSQNNLNNLSCYSTTLGASKNASVKKHSKTPVLKSNLSTQHTGRSVAKGVSDSLLNATADEPEHQKAADVRGSAGELDSSLSAGRATAKVNFNVFPNSNIVRSSNIFKAENTKVQNNKNLEVNKSEESNKCTVMLDKTAEESSDKLYVGTVPRDVPPTITFLSSSCLCDAAEECDHDTGTSSTTAVDVSPQRRDPLSAGCVRNVETCSTSCTDNEQEGEFRSNRAEAKENKVSVDKMRSFATVSDKETCKLFQPSQTRAANSADITSATVRRVNFRNSVNKTITGSFSSDAPRPAPAAVTRSAATRALSAPGRSILVQKNKRPPLHRTVNVDMSDGEEGDKGSDVQSAPTRRRSRTADPRRKARQRPVEEIVTMVSLLSDGSDQEADPTGPHLQHGPCQDGRNSPSGQNRSDGLGVRKPPKSGKCFLTVRRINCFRQR